MARLRIGTASLDWVLGHDERRPLDVSFCDLDTAGRPDTEQVILAVKQLFTLRESDERHGYHTRAKGYGVREIRCP